MKKMSPKTIAALAVVLCTIPLWAAALAGHSAHVHALKDQAASEVLQASRAAAWDVERWLDSHAKGLSMEKAGRKPTGFSASSSVLASDTGPAEFVSLMVFDQAAPRDKAASYGHTFSIAGFSLEDFAVRVQARRKTLWSPAFEAPGTQRVIAAVGRPGADGVAVGLLDISPLKRELAQGAPSPGGKAVLAEKNNNSIIASDAQARAMNDSGAFQNLGGEPAEFEHEGKRYLGARAAVGDTGWFVLTAQDRSSAYGQVRRVRIAFWLGAAGALLLMLTAVWRLAPPGGAPVFNGADPTAEPGSGEDAETPPGGPLEEGGGASGVEAELARTKTFLENLMESSLDTIVSTDLHGVIEYINPRVQGLLGRTAREMIGQRVSAHYCRGVEDARAIMNGLEEREGFTTHDLQMRTSDGRVIDVSASVSLLKNEDGRVIGTLGLLRDETYKKRLEASLQHAQKMEAIGTLAGGVAHDFNNLLMGMQGHVSLMLLETGKESSQRTRLKRIEQLIYSGADLTRQLLSLARGGETEVRIENAAKIVANAAEMFGRTRKEIAITQETESGLWAASVDRGQLEQVLLNLFMNAWHAMPKGGHLHLELKNEVLDQASARSIGVSPGDYVRISVRDNGCGMDEETRRQVFDPFFTTKKRGRGTGLGLTNAYGIMTNHGGAITVESQLGQGATFRLHLPATREAAEKPPRPQESIRLGTQTVLLIDDEDAVREVGAEMIRALGYTVLTAGSGKEAIACLDGRKDAVDLVILDVVMPDMSGEETFMHLRSMAPEIKVLLSSGYSSEGQASRILAQGGAAFVQKPFNMTTLSNALHDALAETPRV